MTPTPVHPALLLPLVVAGWLLLCLLTARMSGWQRLAERYASDAPVEGERFRFASATFGWRGCPVNYGGAIFATAGPCMLALSVLFTFRPGHPRLAVPWSAIEHCERTRRFFGTWVAVRIAGLERPVLLAGGLGEAVMRHWVLRAGSAQRAWPGGRDAKDC